ncbi:structural maintenance of chromosomes protein 2-like [Limulus polyphemus]|uniref:Structural maintenance of chromosomes protein n=1 Tax=Limulus polyphemus TaxID=6850 RepID=A0ABM1BKI6_LIMPO|nr:structural maintenance of chromosomes protein 2-like [Limulus polyphemus]
MHIKSMVIDGFKSYGQRTEINGFDPLFNAITGLNGSGKSNILDAICFLLGITNLTQVRATNLQELVYKNGQAGVTKATVSITFDNNNKKQSPLGYEQYDEITITRQVVIGGRNKYLINGCNANNTRVQDLFRSVQLNVNNPHFLIMQGRITKVLNMKPPEILSMIEEAAGTRMYESKKQSAEKTIEKKDAKLKEIDTILNEEITPTLTRLKTERQAYMEYTKVVRELEHLTKLYIAWQFVETQELCQKSAETLKEMKENITSHQNHIVQVEKNVKELDQHINELEKQKDEEAGGKLLKLEEALKEKQMSEAKSNSDLQYKKDCLKEENKKKKDLQKNLDEDAATTVSKEKQLQKLVCQLEKLQQDSKVDSEALTAAQKHFQAVSAGLSSNEDGEEATLADQLMTAKNDIANADTETKQAEMKLKHAEGEIKKKQTDCKKTEKEYQKDQGSYQALEKELNKIKVEMDTLEYEDGKEENLLAEKRLVAKDVDNLKEKVENLEAKFPNLTFEYKDPEKNFNRHQVHGLVCHLVKVKDPKTSTALQVTAGGKLYNIVVESEVVGKKLLEKGQLKRRYTIIPLNKIMGQCIDNNTLKKAEALVGKENVHTALSLVGYEKEVEAAMKYVFGSTLVCPSMNTAKEVTFAEGIKKRTVTLDGEVFDPSGTLSGGAMPQSSSVLLHLIQLKEFQDELNTKQKQLQEIEKEVSSLKKVADKYRSLKQRYDLKQHEMELLKSRLQQSTHHQQLEELQRFQKLVEEEQTTVTKCLEVKKKAQERVKDLEIKIKDAKAVREQELRAAEEAISKCKKKAGESSKLTKEKEQEAESLKLEVEELQKGLSTYTEQMKAIDDAIQGYEKQAEALGDTLKEKKAEVAAAMQEVKAQKAHLKAQSEEIGRLQKEREALRKDIDDKKLHIQQLEHDVNKTNKETKEATQKVQQMIVKYEWIEQEKQYFGVSNTEYDFVANDPKEAGRRIQKLQETKDKLGKNVNMRAHNMMNKAEEQYQDLLRKKRIVENDKSKIAAVIKELDEKKNQALREAWEKVNKDFGSIFSMLLPGTNAKLIPPEGKSVLDGLEVKVAFGDVWKESLNELSGGQRSLVALSLILSLLLFKPAPIYILDEVDAALDLSHTQNIGQMLRSHFKHSQFIIVSLKDGMFNNANVLFKTKFIDGSSTVNRFAQQRSSGPSRK